MLRLAIAESLAVDLLFVSVVVPLSYFESDSWLRVGVLPSFFG
jgi:hypothetical protein